MQYLSTTGGTNVWSVWTGTSTSCTTETTATWGYWCDTSTSSSTSVTADQTWAYWTAESGTAGHVFVRQAPKTTQAQTFITPKQAAAMERQRKEAEKAEAERQQRLAQAKVRAEKTLKGHLTPEQRRAWNENRAFFVTSQSGRKFKIKEGMAHNFFEVDEFGKEIREFCAHLDNFVARCPVADNVLAQLLALRFNEAMILKKANVWDITSPGRPMIQRSA